MELPYLLQIIYRVAVILFTLNMVAGLFLKVRADATRDPAAMVRAFRWMRRSDWFVSLPTLAVILFLNYYINGDAVLPNSSIKLNYAVLAVAVYSSMMFIFIIHPMRATLARLAADEPFDGEKYRKLSGMWVMFGIVELGPLVLVILLSL